MRKTLLATAVAALLAGAFAGTASAECMQWPNPFGWDQIEVCHESPIEPADPFTS